MSSENSPIPVINISEFTPECAEQLVNAASTHGFVFIEFESTNLKYKDVERMFEISKGFFALPTDEKQKILIGENNRGWSSMHSETLDPENQRRGDFKEAMNFGEFKDGKAQQPMPQQLLDHESELSEFFTDCHNMCKKLLQLFALGLKIDEKEGGKDWFSSRHDETKGWSGTVLRILYYPAIPEGSDYIPEVDVRAGAHSDYGSLTLLFQRPGQEGLEILSHGWKPVPVHPASIETSRPPPILINIGDLMSYWTGGLLKSTVHRVVFPSSASKGGNDRYSMAFFCHPLSDALLEPVPSEAVKQKVSHRHAGAGEEELITAAQHLKKRLDATYQHRHILEGH